MTTITIEKSNLQKKHFVDEKEFLIYIIDYMQDLSDIDNVKNEMKNDDGYRVSFDNYIKNV